MSNGSPFGNAKGHDIANIFRLGNDLCFNERFINMIDPGRIRHFSRIIYSYHLTLTGSCNKTYVGNRCNHRLVKFAFQSFLYDLHMQHA